MENTTASPRILCVCLGNICRSPMAEAVLRAMDPALVVDSAGTGAWHLGKQPHPDAVRAGARRGYDLAGQRARRFSAADFDAFDLILVMDDANLRDVTDLRPAGSPTPVQRLLDHAPESGVTAVPDPWYTGDFDGALDLIEAGCRGVLRALGRA
jgi:protein-tyrosine phosphatase